MEPMFEDAEELVLLTPAVVVDATGARAASLLFTGRFTGAKAAAVAVVVAAGATKGRTAAAGTFGAPTWLFVAGFFKPRKSSRPISNWNAAF